MLTMKIDLQMLVCQPSLEQPKTARRRRHSPDPDSDAITTARLEASTVPSHPKLVEPTLFEAKAKFLQMGYIYDEAKSQMPEGKDPYGIRLVWRNDPAGLQLCVDGRELHIRKTSALVSFISENRDDPIFGLMSRVRESILERGTQS